MANSTAQALTNIYAQRAQAAYQSDYQRRQKALAEQQKKAEEEAARSKDNGGLIGGLGYLGEKFFLGVTSSVEGITDYTIGGFAKLFGADELAEDIFDNDWLNYSHADEWFDPSEVWEFAGDVFGGIGTSIPAIAAAGITAAATGGASIPVSVASFATAGLGAAGNATKEAYKETGTLGGKEFAYGALSGALEGGIEAVSGAIGAGTGQIIKGIAKGAGKETVEAASKSSVKSALSWLGKSFGGEAFEEGVSEFVSPYLQRWTYNPEAENASVSEILYSSVVGGLSGMIMNGADVTVRGVSNLRSGNKLVDAGKDSDIMARASQFADYQKKNNSDNETYKYITEKYDKLSESIANTGGKIVNPSQRMLLAELNRGVNVASLQNAVRRSAFNIVSNPEAIVERLNKYGYKDAEGKAYTYTVKDIMGDIDVSKPESIIKALQSNSVLRELAIADTVGHMMIDAERFANSVMQGDKLFSQVDLNRFLAQADEREIAQVGEVLGIKDWNTVDADGLRQAIQGFVDEGGITVWKSRNALRKRLESLTPETKGVPFRVAMRDGDAKRYSDGNVDVAITKNDGVYTLYDYGTGLLSRHLSQSDVNTLLDDYSSKKAEIKKIRAASTSSTAAAVPLPKGEGYGDITAYAKEQMAIAERVKAEDAEIDTYARENISDYSSLSEPNKGMIKKLIREGRANNIESDTLLTMARVSARSGLDIVFDSEKSGAGDAKISGNTIYIDPKAPKERMRAKLLLHEAGHAIFSNEKWAKTFDKILKQVKPERYEEISKRYSEMYRIKNVNFSAYQPIVQEEIIMHHIEDVLGNMNAWDYILKEDMSVKDKFLSFLGKQTEAYSTDEKLTRTAKKLLNTYKKMFAELAARNSQSNAYGETLLGVNPENMQGSGKNVLLTNTNPENMHDSERNAFRDSSSGTANDSLLPYSEELKDFILDRGDYIIDSFEKLKDFVNMAFDEPNKKATGYFGIVSVETLEKIKNSVPNLPKEMDGKLFKENRDYSIAATLDSVRHMVDEKELTKNDVLDYLDRLADTILEFDTVAFDYYYQGNQKTQGLLFKKTFEDGVLISFDLVSNKKRSMVMQTLYLDNADYQKKKSAETLLMQKPQPTPKAQVGQTSTDSISQTTEKSNSSDEKFLKERNAFPEGENSETSEDSERIGYKELLGEEEYEKWKHEQTHNKDVFDAEAIKKKGAPVKSASVGQLQKKLANNTKEKVYSMADAYRVMGRLSGISRLSAKTRGEIAAERLKNAF